MKTKPYYVEIEVIERKILKVKVNATSEEIVKSHLENINHNDCEGYAYVEEQSSKCESFPKETKVIKYITESEFYTSDELEKKKSRQEFTKQVFSCIDSDKMDEFKDNDEEENYIKACVKEKLGVEVERCHSCWTFVPKSTMVKSGFTDDFACEECLETCRRCGKTITKNDYENGEGFCWSCS